MKKLEMFLNGLLGVEKLALCESEKIAWCILESLEYMLGEMLIVEEITNE